MPPSGLFVGLATLDVVHVVERAPAPNEKTTALRQDLAAGGPAANAAVTFAVLGGDATLLTALGSHPLAQVIANELAEHGVSIIDAMPAMAQPPAVSLVRVVESTGERSVSSTNAAGIEAIAPAVLAQAVAASAVVLVDGHHIGLALAAVKLARERRVSVLLDAGSWKPQLSRLLPFVDAAICSADFADPASQSTVDGLLDYGLTSVAVTAGAGPIAWTTRGGHPASGTITPPQVGVRDTLGAGDAFHGAAAFALASGVGWREALEFAAEVATIRVQHRGPRAWLRALDRTRLGSGRVPPA